MIAFIFAAWLQSTNSRAATARGVAAYQKKDYAAAPKEFANANQLKPTSASAFNLGTSQIASGNREEGSATLAKAMSDRALKADALYNRGNSALASSAYDYAIRDYIDTLKLRPRDANAKRNLEIAILKKQQMQQQSKSGAPKQPQGASGGEKQKQPSAGKQQQQKQQPDADADALLRAVQQQEQEELQRMKKARAPRGRIGW